MRGEAFTPPTEAEVRAYGDAAKVFVTSEQGVRLRQMIEGQKAAVMRDCVYGFEPKEYFRGVLTGIDLLFVHLDALAEASDLRREYEEAQKLVDEVGRPPFVV